MDAIQLQSTIAALDAAIPKQDAKVVLRQYGGGPDETSLVANERGYLRLGIEMLKAAFAATGYLEGANAVHVDVDYLINDDSEVQLDWFERREPEAPAPRRWRLTDLAAMLVGLCFVFTFIIGVVTTYKWIASFF